MSLDAVTAILLIPAIAAALMAALPGYRATARFNVLAALATFLVALSLLFVRPQPGPYLHVDDLNNVFIVLTTFVGFMSMENGLILAATGAKGMPLVVEISIAFAVLAAFIVIGVFLFRIRERFDSVDVQALDSFRGERR